MSSLPSDEGLDAGSRVGEDHVAGHLPAEPSPGAVRAELTGYTIGLVLAAVLTAAAFWSLGSHGIYGPGIVMAIVALGLAQVGVHLVFFLHMTTSPDNSNNILALAFGLVIVSIVVFGTIWAMYHMNHNMI